MELQITTEEGQLASLTKISQEIALQCDQIVINDETTLAVATQILSKANDKAKEIEKMRVALKDLYFQAGKKIDEIAKAIMKPLEEAVVKGKQKIIDYDTEKKRIAQIEIDRINGIKMAMENWHNKAIAAFNACTTDKELVVANDTYIVNFPSDDKFAEFLGEGQVMRKTLHDYTKQMRIAINTPKEADTEVLPVIEQVIATQVAEVGTEALIDAQAEKTRGMTGNWRFRVSNKNIILAEYLCVDEVKVKAFMKENKDLLGKGANISGVEFYFEPSVTFR